MKVFLIGMAMALVSMLFIVFQEEYNRFNRYLHKEKFTTEEVAAAASQYRYLSDYSEGRIVFNQPEAIKAAEYVLKKNLKLNEDFTPLDNSYWKDTISYTIEFFDDSNTTFPFLYEHDTNYFTLTLTDPTVIVTINLGSPDFSTFTNSHSFFRTAAHTWQER